MPLNSIGSWPVVQKKTRYSLHYLQEQKQFQSAKMGFYIIQLGTLCTRVTGYFCSDCLRS